MGRLAYLLHAGLGKPAGIAAAGQLVGEGEETTRKKSDRGRPLSVVLEIIATHPNITLVPA